MKALGEAWTQTEMHLAQSLGLRVVLILRAEKSPCIQPSGLYVPRDSNAVTTSAGQPLLQPFLNTGHRSPILVSRETVFWR